MYMMHKLSYHLHHTAIFKEIWIWIRSIFVMSWHWWASYFVTIQTIQTIGWGIYWSLFLLWCGYWYHMVVLLLSEHWHIFHTMELWRIVLGCNLQFILMILIFISMTFFCNKVTCISLTWDQLNNWHACVFLEIIC